ncbi:MAG: inositol monophosphatase family protein [Methanomassiliicoccales archaeon]|jgi:fructose-1,6-bisphosphatase/inositol monophosphatase family enzyme
MRDLLETISDQVRKKVNSLPKDFDRSKELCMGADGTPTLNIDKVAEDVIVEYITDNDIPLNILSEEAGYIDNRADKTLVIDPIDGTYNSVMGIPFYSVSMAIGTRSMADVEAGLVQNVITGEAFYAEKGKGAFQDGCRLKVRKFIQKQSTFFVYMGKHSKLDCYNVTKKSNRSRSMGCASLEMCMVAKGSADGYYFNADHYDKSIRVIDIAASALILREAGGEIVDLSGNRLDMPFDLKVRSNFLAYGDEVVKGVLL